MRGIQRDVVVVAVSCLLACCIARQSAGGPTIVGDGGDLEAVVAAARDGDVIEIRSNQSFGTLSWTDKHLTVQAGAGFTPTVRRILDIKGVRGGVGGEFRGLKISGPVVLTGGLSWPARFDFYDVDVRSEVSLGGTGDADVDVTFTNSKMSTVKLGGTGSLRCNSIFTDNEISSVELSGTGSLVHSAVFRGNHFQNAYFHGTGDLTGHVLLEHNRFDGDLVASAISDAHYELTVRDNVVDGYASSGTGVTSVVEDNVLRSGFGGGTSFDDTADITLLRNVIGDGIGFGFGSYSSTRVFAANNLIVAGDDSVRSSGILLRSLYSTQRESTTDMSFVNNTVVGFEQGIAAVNADRTSAGNSFRLSFENMLLYNDVDVEGLEQREIRNSLISDGTFAGANGNFAGIPSLWPSGALRAGSIGIDAGENLAALSLWTDAVGNRRILDGDGDGVAVVDVGALEFVVPEPAASMLFIVGTLLLLVRNRVM